MTKPAFEFDAGPLPTMQDFDELSPGIRGVVGVGQGGRMSCPGVTNFVAEHGSAAGTLVENDTVGSEERLATGGNDHLVPAIEELTHRDGRIHWRKTLGLKPFLLSHETLELDPCRVLGFCADGLPLQLPVFAGLNDGAKPPGVRLPLVDGALTVHPPSGHRRPPLFAEGHRCCLHRCLRFTPRRVTPQARSTLTWGVWWR